MLFSLVDAIFSIFKKRPMSALSQELDFINDQWGDQRSDVFFYFVRAVTKMDFNLSESLEENLSRIEVTALLFNKMPDLPQHEYLSFETRDHLDMRRVYVLDRNVSMRKPEHSDRKNIFENLQKRAAANFARLLSDPSSLASVKEGLSPGPSTTKDLSYVDIFSLTSAKSADFISESFKDKECADDKVKGEGFAFSTYYMKGSNMRYFKPKKKLSLFDFALLAKVVHDMFPDYSFLSDNCYLYAGVIYFVAQTISGGPSCEPLSEESKCHCLLNIANSGLTNQYGRYGDIQVGDIDPNHVAAVLKKFRELRDKELALLVSIDLSDST